MKINNKLEMCEYLNFFYLFPKINVSRFPFVKFPTSKWKNEEVQSDENLIQVKVDRSKGCAPFIVYVYPSKNKLDGLRNKEVFVYIYLLFSI